MKHLVFNIPKSMPFLITLVVFICSAMYMFTEEHKTGIDDAILTWSFYISIPALIVTFIIMWKSRYYDDDEDGMKPVGKRD
jgi:heme/copper-type cytochrome/quinol oxidase subunit 2